MSNIDNISFYIVPTPIGNLGDITIRALEVLRSVDLIFSEDTRTTLKLLNHFEIKKKLISYHKDNENSSAEKILTHILSGETVALTTDAGTPCISDPGQIIVNKLIKNNIKFQVLPGATAFIPAAIKSGFPTEKIFFSGFLPLKNGERVDYLTYLKNNIYATIIFYEAPHRIKKTLNELIEIFTRPISVSRELTKLYETTYYINSKEDISFIVEKGEFVIVVNNNTPQPKKQDIELIVENLRRENLSNQDIMKVLKALGFKRNKAYEVVMEKQDS